MFSVHWSPGANRRTTHLNKLYYGERRQPGEISGKAVLQGLKGISSQIELTDASYVPLPDGNRLSRHLMPNNYDIYRSFTPDYAIVNRLRAPRALVSAMKGNKDLSIDDLRKMAPGVNSNTLKKKIMPLVGTQATNQNIRRAMHGTYDESHGMHRSWTRPPAKKMRSVSKSNGYSMPI